MRLSTVVREYALGTNGSLVRDGVFDVLGLSNSDGGSNYLSFLDDEKYLKEIAGNRSVSSVLCKPEFVNAIPAHIGGIFVTDQPRLSFFALHNALCSSVDYVKQNQKTIIGNCCTIAPMTSIAVDNIVIGNNVTIDDFVSIQGRVTIGDNVHIHSGVCIGSSGFEYKVTDEDVLSVNHIGGVVIAANVTIHNNATIHRAVFPWDTTLVGEHTKINSSAHIDHGAKLGRRVIVGAGCIISGRVCIQDDVRLGPGCVVSNRILVEQGSRVSLGAVVTKQVACGQTVTGNFALPHETFINNLRKYREDT